MRGKRKAAPNLSDDLIAEILWRLPARPLCRFKCVSRSWRALIADPVHRRRLALNDAASGFFYHTHADSDCPSITELDFTALCPPPPDELGGSPAPPLVVGDPAFPFLPSRYARFLTDLVDSCNGLLLLRYNRGIADSLYIVCNPSTQYWAELPPPPPRQPAEPGHAVGGVLDHFLAHHHEDLNPALLQVAQEHQQDMWRPRSAALAFDPAVSSANFHVFELVNRDEHKTGSAVKAVHIYSSETGTWVRRENEWWGYEIVSSGHHAYANGSLHLTIADADNGLVASVDPSGTTWKVTRVCPEHPANKLGGNGGFIGASRRRLLFLDAGSGSGYAPELAIYALEPGRGGGAERWVLKQRVRNLHQSGRMWFGNQHAVVGIHPECGVIFLFDSRGRKLVAYDMDQGTARVICTFTGESRKYHFFPYVPLHS